MRIWGLLQCRKMGRSRLPLAIVVSVAGPAVATFLLRPRSGLIEPAPVEVEQYFTAFQLERAEDFRGLQRALGLAGLGVGVAALAVLARRPPERLIARVKDRPLLGGAGVNVGEVYRVDASRRTSAANAYVNGLGNSKRVVLYDNLIDRFPRDEVRIVVAHELAHQKHNDLLRGLAWLALVAPAGTFLTQALAERFGGRGRLGSPARLPAVALAISLVALGLGAASNVVSRQVEARADAFALDLTRDPADFVKFERRIAIRNISDPDPPRLFQLLFATHPTTAERIGIGEAWRDEP